MYRTANISLNTLLLKLESGTYDRMIRCIASLEVKRERRVSRSEFIRRAIKKACQDVEESGFHEDGE